MDEMQQNIINYLSLMHSENPEYFLEESAFHLDGKFVEELRKNYFLFGCSFVNKNCDNQIIITNINGKFLLENTI